MPAGRILPADEGQAGQGLGHFGHRAQARAGDLRDDRQRPRLRRGRSLPQKSRFRAKATQNSSDKSSKAWFPTRYNPAGYNKLVRRTDPIDAKCEDRPHTLLTPFKTGMFCLSPSHVPCTHAGHVSKPHLTKFHVLYHLNFRRFVTEHIFDQWTIAIKNRSQLWQVRHT